MIKTIIALLTYFAAAILLFLSTVVQTPTPILPPVDLEVPFESQVGNTNKIGETKSTIDRYGCGITSLSMVFRYYGLDTDVNHTNQALYNAGVYFDDYLTWDHPEKYSQATGGLVKSVTVAWTTAKDSLSDRVNKELSANHPVIAFLTNTPSSSICDDPVKCHFVVITGRDANGQYKINDPYKDNAKSGKNIDFKNNAIGASLDGVKEYIFISSTDFPPTNGIPLIPEVAGTYRVLGGSHGFLSNPLRKGEDLPGYPGVRWQEFEGGAIYRLPNTNEGYAIYKPIWQRYVTEGGPAKMGLPLRGIYEYPSHGTVYWQADFEKGSIIWTNDINVLHPDNAVKVEYYDNGNLSGAPAYTRLVDAIRQNWGDGRPDIAVTNLDSHSIRWTASINIWFPLGWTYDFLEKINGNFRVLIDGKVVLDGYGKSVKDSFSQYLGRGMHTIVVEFSKNSNPAYAGLAWAAWPFWHDPGSDQPDVPQLIPPVYAAEPDTGAWDMPIDLRPNLGSPESMPLPTAQPTPIASHSPKEPVKAFFDGMNQMNVNVIMSALAPSNRLLARPVFQFTFDQVNKNGFKVTFDRMQYSVLTQNQTSAIVSASGRVTAISLADNSHSESNFSLDIPMAYQDQQWYISLDMQTIINFLKQQYGY
jgi:hypothetical protein